MELEWRQTEKLTEGEVGEDWAFNGQRTSF